MSSPRHNDSPRKTPSNDGAPARRLSGRTPVLLDNPSIVWRIREGQAEVYAVRILDGRPAGVRRHLFTAGMGDALFGFGRGVSGLALQMVGHPGTLADEESADRFFAATEAGEQAGVARLMDRFLDGLCAGLTRDVAPKPGARQDVRAGGTIAFAAPAVIRPYQGVWWLRRVLPQGANREGPVPSMRFLGIERMQATDAVPLGVLTPETWIETDPADGNSAVESLDSAALLVQGVLREAFDRFADLFFRCLETELRLADVDIFDAMHTKSRTASLSRTTGLRRLREALDGEPVSSAVECDHPPVAACAMVAAAIGVEIPQADFRGHERVEEIAAAWGIKHRPVTLRENWWKRDGGPLLGFLREGDAGEIARAHRPIALLQTKSGRYTAHDPEAGTSFRVTRDTVKKISPGAFSFYRPFPDKPLGVVDLIRYAAFGSRRDFLYILVCGLAFACLAVIPPVAIKQIFSEVIPDADGALLAQIVAMLVIVAVSVLAISLMRLAALHRMTGKMDFHLEPALWERLLSLPASYHRREGAGELADRADGIHLVRVRLCDSFLTTLLTGIFASFNVVMLFVFGPGLALPALGMLLLGALAGAFFNVRQIANWRDYYDLQGRIAGMLVQLFSGIAKIRVAGAEDRVFGLWAGAFATQQKKLMRAGRQQNALLVFNQVFPVAAMMVLFLGAARLSEPMMETSSFLAFLAAFIALQTALLAITTSAVQLTAVLPLYRRMKPILETLPENLGEKTDPGRLRGRIELSQVHFRYEPAGPAILEGINLEIAPGEFVALVGPSGSGKSTLLRLLLGFETPTSGSIRYDHLDLADLDLIKLRRRNLGVVMQECGLLPGDILSNIVGMRNLSLEEAWEAARMAGLEDEIRQMPLGMHTPIGEGESTFSGGQKQRVAIARALAGKPSILLLDEATSALDNRTQEIVARSLDGLRVTRVVVAHRLSTVKNADRIVVLEGGRIVESGTYRELMDKQGRFCSLVKRQLLPE